MYSLSYGRRAHGWSIIKLGSIPLGLVLFWFWSLPSERVQAPPLPLESPQTSRSRALAPSRCAFCGLASVSLRKHHSLSEVLTTRPAGPAGFCSHWLRACTAGSALPGSCCCGLWSGRRERGAHGNHRNSTPGSPREWNLRGCPLPGTPKESEQCVLPGTRVTESYLKPFHR